MGHLFCIKASFVTFVIYSRILCYCQSCGNVLLSVHLQSQDKTQALKCNVGKVRVSLWCVYGDMRVSFQNNAPGIHKLTASLRGSS